jgi:D-3-phosphoglycerate dehydrogenase
MEHSVNYVNAESIAANRGVEISATTHPTPVDYTNLITFKAGSAEGEVCISATLFSEKIGRIVSLNDFRVEFKAEGHLLYILNRDVPGVVGKVGTLLGDRDINIAEYNLARAAEGGLALAIVTIDTPLDPETLRFMRSFREMQDVRQITL